jgi:hexokinase
MADVPQDLLSQIQRLEELFTVSGEKLKEITDHFVSELERGLREENATIVRLTNMFPRSRV